MAIIAGVFKVHWGSYSSSLLTALLKTIEFTAAGFAGAAPLGLSRLTTFTHVVLPQALRIALPGTNTMLVDLLKSTSLLVTISAAELMSEGQLIASQTFRALEVYAVIAAIYFALCYPLS